MRRTHGFSALQNRHPLYNTWKLMRNRCNSPNCPAYKYYGGRGIKICERWNNFKNFLTDVGERPFGLRLDRINVNGNYEPNNIRWATPKEQTANRRPAQEWKRESKRIDQFTTEELLTELTR